MSNRPHVSPERLAAYEAARATVRALSAPRDEKVTFGDIVDQALAKTYAACDAGELGSEIGHFERDPDSDS